jgi:hypothetical protein
MQVWMYAVLGAVVIAWAIGASLQWRVSRRRYGIRAGVPRRGDDNLLYYGDTIIGNDQPGHAQGPDSGHHRHHHQGGGHHGGHHGGGFGGHGGGHGGFGGHDSGGSGGGGHH